MLELRSVGLKFAHYVAEEDGRLIATIIDKEEYEFAKTIEGEIFDVCLIQGRYSLETDGKVILAPRSIGGGAIEFDLLGRTFQVTPKPWTWEPDFLIKEQKQRVGLIRVRGFTRNRAVGEFPDSFSNLISVFILWITLTRGKNPFRCKLNYNNEIS